VRLLLQYSPISEIWEFGVDGKGLESVLLLKSHAPSIDELGPVMAERALV